MLDTTFVKVACWDSYVWDCSRCVVDLIWGMAKKEVTASPTIASAASQRQNRVYMLGGYRELLAHA